MTIEHRKSVVLEKHDATYQGQTKQLAKFRKLHPLFEGVMKYFPDALEYVAYVSHIGNEQHNPGQPLHWSREKSSDHLNCAARHLNDHGKGEPYDTDDVLHLGKLAWRSLAELQLYLEKMKKSGMIDHRWRKLLPTFEESQKVNMEHREDRDEDCTDSR